MARYLRKNELQPDLVLVSTSARTLQTADLVLRELEAAAPDYRDALYLAEPGKIVAHAAGRCPPSVRSVMVVGHNPGLEELATLLAREPVRRKERARRDVLEEKFPTAALAVLDFDIDRWRDLAPGEGQAGGFRAAERLIASDGSCKRRLDRQPPGTERQALPAERDFADILAAQHHAVRSAMRAPPIAS